MTTESPKRKRQEALTTEVEAHYSASWTTDPERLDRMYGELASFLGDFAVYRRMVGLLEGTGIITFEDFHHMPAIINQEGQALPLFEFVEVLDAAADYDEISDELQLTFTQIHGAMAFLRRMSMVNPKGFDPDQYELALAARDPELIEALRDGVNDEGGLRVFDAD